MRGVQSYLTLGATLLFSVLGLGGNDAYAHIKNEATQFPDIEYSQSRFDIVVLVGAGIIPETPVFEPDQALTMRDLATWVVLARGLARGGEVPDTDALASLAEEQGLVESLDGNASVNDLDRLFFDGTMKIDGGDRIPTKAEAASLIAGHLVTEAGAVLLTSLGLENGATGEVTEVRVEKGHHGNVYVITIGDVTHDMDVHGRVANGPTDLLQWLGRTVGRSFVRGKGHHAKWTYLEAVPREAETAGANAESTSAGKVAANNAPVVEAGAAGEEESATPTSSMISWLLGIAALLGVGLFFRRRRVL